MTKINWQERRVLFYDLKQVQLPNFRGAQTFFQEPEFRKGQTDWVRVSKFMSDRIEFNKSMSWLTSLCKYIAF